MKQKYIVGDVVMYDNKIMVVKEPRDGSHFDLSCHEEGLVYCLVDIDEIKPVRITPEILEKNGWRTQNRWYYYLDVAEGFISYIGIDFKHKSNKGHLYVEVNGNNMVEIQYCHELQHFLFGLGLKQKMEV
jgi:hypothetical protein|nr:MAG TPA: hypothetical protein [Caudoviricetes sp.]